MQKKKVKEKDTSIENANIKDKILRLLTK